MTSSAPPRFEPGSFRDPGTREVGERDGFPELAPQWAGVLEHTRVPVVSYPYEWSFGMLRDAALLQLDLTLAALEEGMTLRRMVERLRWAPAQSTWSEDPMVERLLRNRRGQDIEYSDAAAREHLTRHFGAVTHETMASGTRTLYHCRPRSGSQPHASG